MDDIKTFAIFPDKRFKYGGIAYIGVLGMDAKELKEFIKDNSFAQYAKNSKLQKCFDFANYTAVGYNADSKRVYMAAYRFYPPFLWSRRKIAKKLEESFDECRFE